jgi:hypothetical protein
MAAPIEGAGIPPVEPLAPEAKAKVASPGHSEGESGTGKGNSRRRPAPAAQAPDISDLAGVAYELQALAREDPARFRGAMAAVAAAVDLEAALAPHPHARALQELAERFREAGRTGTLPPLLPLDAQTGGEGGIAHRLHSYASQQAAAAGETVRHPALDLANLIRGVLSAR